MRSFLVACTIIVAAIASCSMPNFAPPKLGSVPVPIVADAPGAVGPR
jgi:hypothetical protein